MPAARLCDFSGQSLSQAEKLAGADLTRKNMAKRIDAVAAAQILEAFIEAKTHK